MAALDMESPTVSAIYASYVANDRPTDPVRLSLFHAVGACARAAWLGLRWAAPPERHDGQKLRNFARRRTEGAELASTLTAAGAKVSFLDLETLRPFEVTLAGGHARVKVDGIAIGLPEAPKKRHVVVARALDEAGFRRLRQEGVETARPADAAAMQVAMAAFGAPRGAILAMNLGTDELLLERVEADPIRAARVSADVEWIVGSPQPPADAAPDRVPRSELVRVFDTSGGTNFVRKVDLEGGDGPVRRYTDAGRAVTVNGRETVERDRLVPGAATARKALPFVKPRDLVTVTGADGRLNLLDPAELADPTKTVLRRFRGDGRAVTVSGNETVERDGLSRGGGRTPYLMEPTLTEAQMGRDLPPDVAMRDDGIAVYRDTGEPVPIVRRPAVLPLTRDPDGNLMWAAPKALEVAGSLLPSAGTPAKLGLSGVVKGASRSERIYNPPVKPQRPIEADYPAGVPADDAGRITHDPEGRPLGARFVAGRNVVGQGEKAISPAELDAITEATTGNAPASVARSNQGGDSGRAAFHPGSRRPLGISIADDLPAEKAERVLAHEVGHVIDEVAGQIPTKGLNTELRQVYNTLNTGQERTRNLTGPEQAGYSSADVPRELMVEAVRAYLTDPNYLKTVAPKTAAAIRKAVNTNPVLMRIIQFNSVAGMAVGLEGPSAPQTPGDTAAHGAATSPPE